MIIVILTLLVVNLFVIDFCCIKIINKYKKNLNLFDLNLDDFWKED